MGKTNGVGQESGEVVNHRIPNVSKSDGSGAKEFLSVSQTPIVALQRNIGFLSCLGLLIGSIIGLGIFISPKGVLIGSGSIGVSLIVWLLCGIKTLLGALAYVELGTMLPNSGGTYYYQLEAFHPNRKEKMSFWGSLLPFQFSWYNAIFHRPAAFAVQGIATGQYAIKLAALAGCGSTLAPKNSAILAKLIAVLFIMMITAANCYTNKLSTRLIKLFTVAKLSAISFIIISGLTMLSLGTNEALKTGFEGTSLDGLLLAFYSGHWAYGGWDRLNYVARELENPKRDLPRSMIATCVIVTSIYLLVNVSYFAVLSKKNFLASDAVAAGMLAVMLVPFTSILGLISLVSFTRSFFHFMTMVALLVLRKRRKSNKDVFQVPLVIIFINMMTNLGLVIIPFFRPRIEFAMIVGFMLAGVVVYTIFVYYRKTISGIGRIAVIVQKIMLVVPPEDNDV